MPYIDLVDSEDEDIKPELSQKNVGTVITRQSPAGVSSSRYSRRDSFLEDLKSSGRIYRPTIISSRFDFVSGQFRHIAFESFQPSDEVALDFLTMSHPERSLTSITPRLRLAAELDRELFLDYPSIPAGVFAKSFDAPGSICAHRTTEKCGYWAQCFNFRDQKAWLIPGWKKFFPTVQSLFWLLDYLDKCIPLHPPQLPGCQLCRRIIIGVMIENYEHDAISTLRPDWSNYRMIREY